MSGCLELDIECPKQFLKMRRASARGVNVCSDRVHGDTKGLEVS
jgi:hypothetical protein